MFAVVLAVVLSVSASIASLPAVDQSVAPIEMGVAFGVEPTASNMARQQQVEQINVNTADAAKLQEIPGIGEALAARIIAFRDEHGPFEKVDDLLNVRGIGVKSLDKLRPYLTVKPVK